MSANSDAAQYENCSRVTQRPPKPLDPGWASSHTLGPRLAKKVRMTRPKPRDASQLVWLSPAMLECIRMRYARMTSRRYDGPGPLPIPGNHNSA